MAEINFAHSIARDYTHFMSEGDILNIASWTKGPGVSVPTVMDYAGYVSDGDMLDLDPWKKGPSTRLGLKAEYADYLSSGPSTRLGLKAEYADYLSSGPSKPSSPTGASGGGPISSFQQVNMNEASPIRKAWANSRIPEAPPLNLSPSGGYSRKATAMNQAAPIRKAWANSRIPEAPPLNLSPSGGYSRKATAMNQAAPIRKAWANSRISQAPPMSGSRAAGGLGRGVMGAAKLGGKAALGALGLLGAGAVMAGAFAYGMAEESIKSGALTKNLDITSGAGSSYLMNSPGLISTVIAANVKNVQGMSNLKGEDYLRSMSRAAPASGGPMMFSPQGTERGMSGGGNMGVTGNLALSLNNLRRGR